MGIRKEIKEVIRTMDVRDPRLALEAIQKIVARPRITPPKMPSIVITKKGDKLDIVGDGITMRDTLPVLISVLKTVAREIKQEGGCQSCPDKAGCPDAN